MPACRTAFTADGQGMAADSVWLAPQKVCVSPQPSYAGVQASKRPSQNVHGGPLHGRRTGCFTGHDCV